MARLIDICSGRREIVIITAVTKKHQYRLFIEATAVAVIQETAICFLEEIKRLHKTCYTLLTLLNAECSYNS